MNKANNFVPEGYHSVTPYLAIRDADKLVEFLQKVFDAKEHRLWRREDGSFMHGEFRIGDSLVMIGDVQDNHGSFPGMLYVYVQDVDVTFNKAIQEGAKALEEPSQQDYGDRRAAFEDLAGNQWWIATHVEDVPDEEVKRNKDIN